ncbi:MAG: hypothetical protein OEZ13_12285 [Spirochaetia bacterium]|nr:hypothetical protein [Spirochaetia bacterium]
MKKYAVLILILGFVNLCKSLEEKEKQPQVKKEGLSIKIRSIHVDNRSDKNSANISSEEIRSRLEALIKAIIQKDIKTVISQVHKEVGAYADIKAHMIYQNIAKEIDNSKGILHIIFWKTDKLREKYPDIEISSYQEIFSSSHEIALDLFFFSKEECEIYLDFENRPPSGILGNPIYHRIDNRWYLKRIF